MIQRLFTMTSYLFSNMVVSLSGLLYFLTSLALYTVFFDPRQRTPDVDYYVLVLGIFGAALSFLTTLSISAKANRAEYYPIVVRLPSRVEYLAAVLLASMLYAFILQVFIAFLSLLLNGPDLSLFQLAEIPPIWLATDLLMITLALHATDLVAKGWSRVYLFGFLGLLLYLNDAVVPVGSWLTTRLSNAANGLLERGYTPISTLLFDISNWFSNDGISLIADFLGLVFWPFKAIGEAVTNYHFTQTQALAPAIIVLYAAILFFLSADLFASKDLFFSE